MDISTARNLTAFIRHFVPPEDLDSLEIQVCPEFSPSANAVLTGDYSIKVKARTINETVKDFDEVFGLVQVLHHWKTSPKRIPM
jgi:hypothetical protein